MAGIKYFIDFTLITGNNEVPVKTHTGEYADLRLLIKQYINHDDFCQCGGMGRCATCMIAISSNSTRQEKPLNLLSKKNNNRSIKLSCQLALDDELANKYIAILSGRD